MIARDARFRDARRPRGIKPGEQQRRLDLCARDFERMFASAEQTAALDRQRRQAVASPDRRSHQPQGSRDALHRSPHQRRIPDELGIECLTRKDSGEQAHGRARVAEVECAARSLEAAQADAVNAKLPGRRALDADAHCNERRERRATVLALQETLNISRPLCDCAQHRRAMRDGLVARNPDVAGDTGAWTRYETLSGSAHDRAANASAMAASSRSFCAAVPVVMRR